MRAKAPLAMMELLVMTGVFALAAALCLRAFAYADQTSRNSAARDRAVIEAQSTAETLKSVHGDFEELTDRLGGQWNGLMWGLSYDADWTPLAEGGEAVYYILAGPAQNPQSLLGAAEVTVYDAGGGVLCTLPVAWQETEEVRAHG